MKISFDCESGLVGGDVQGKRVKAVEISVNEGGAMVLQVFTEPGRAQNAEVMLSAKAARLVSNVRYAAMESER